MIAYVLVAGLIILVCLVAAGTPDKPRYTVKMLDKQTGEIISFDQRRR